MDRRGVLFLLLEQSGYRRQLQSKLDLIESVTRTNNQLNDILTQLEMKTELSSRELKAQKGTFNSFFEYIYFASDEFIAECEDAYGDSRN